MVELIATMRLLVKALEVVLSRLSEPPVKVTCPVPKEPLPVVSRAPAATTVSPE